MAPPPGSQERRTSLSLPKGKGRVWNSWAGGAARSETRGLPAAGRAGRHSPRRRLCTAGARGTPVSRPPWSQGPGGWARRTRPPPPPGGRGDKGRRAGGWGADARRAHSKHSRTTGSRRLRQEGREQGGALPAAMPRPCPSRTSPRPSDSRDPAQARAHNRLLPPQPTCHSQSQPTLADGPPPPPPGVSAPPPCPSASAQTRGEGPPAGRSRGRREGGEVRAQAVCCQAS